MRQFLFIGAQFQKQVLLCRGLSVYVGPSHYINEFLCIGEQHGLIAPDKVIAAGAFWVGNLTRPCKYIFVITVGQFGCDHAATFNARLNNNGSVTHTCYNAVAGWKVVLIGFGIAAEFGQQAASLFDHVFGQLGMQGRIDGIETMAQHTTTVGSLFLMAALCARASMPKARPLTISTSFSVSSLTSFSVMYLP